MRSSNLQALPFNHSLSLSLFLSLSAANYIIKLKWAAAGNLRAAPELQLELELCPQLSPMPYANFLIFTFRSLWWQRQFHSSSSSSSSSHNQHRLRVRVRDRVPFAAVWSSTLKMISVFLCLLLLWLLLLCLDCFAAAAAGDAVAVVAAVDDAAAVISTSNNGATFPLRPTPAQLPSGNPLWLLHSRVKCARGGQWWGKVAQWGLLLKMNPVPLSLRAPPCPLDSLLSHCSLARWPFRVQFSVIISFIARTLLAFGCGFSPRMLQLLPLPLPPALPLPRLLPLLLLLSSVLLSSSKLSPPLDCRLLASFIRLKPHSLTASFIRSFIHSFTQPFRHFTPFTVTINVCLPAARISLVRVEHQSCFPKMFPASSSPLPPAPPSSTSALSALAYLIKLEFIKEVKK